MGEGGGGGCKLDCVCVWGGGGGRRGRIQPRKLYYCLLRFNKTASGRLCVFRGCSISSVSSLIFLNLIRASL